MNDNLPEINFKEKKEKKRGLLGWLKGRLGAGSGGAMGEAGITPSAMNVGRALGAAKFGASAGFGSFLAGNIGTIATVAIVAVAGGVYLANNAPAPSTGASSAFSSNKNPDNYVPAILRSQAANQGSSLDMFKDTNKGAGLAMEEGPKAPKAPEAKASASDEAAPDANQAAPDQANMAESMMGKLQGGNIGSLTSSLGGGSNKMSGMGGFSNKFNQGATGGKSGFTAGIGTGFQGMPKFDQRKGKMLAMKAASRPVFSSSKAGKKGQFGAGAFGQARGMRATQKSYSGANIDSARSTQDKAWEGSTGSGDTSGGAGLSDGGAGIVTSPSLDNGSGSTGGGGADAAGEPVVPDQKGIRDVSPWAGMPQKAMMLILLSAILSMIGGALVKAGHAASVALGTGELLVAAGLVICGIAAALGAAALVIGIMLMASYGQTLMGSLYTLGGGLAIAGAFMAMAGGGTPGSAISGMMFQSMTALFSPYIMLAAAAGVALVGSMAGGASGSSDSSAPAAARGDAAPGRGDGNSRSGGGESGNAGEGTGRRSGGEPSYYIGRDTKTGEYSRVYNDGTRGPSYANRDEAIASN